MKNFAQLVSSDPNISPQMKTVIAMSDKLLGIKETRKPTTDELLETIIAISNRIDLLLTAIGDSANANLAEAQEFAQGILLNVAGYRKEISAPYLPHDPQCHCENCDSEEGDYRYRMMRDKELTE